MSHSKRIYELWPGKNRFYLKGLLITGPRSNLPIQLSVYLLLLSSLCLYIYFIFPTIMQSTPTLTISYFILLTTTITFMFLTSYRDPGIIPRRPFLQLLQHKIQLVYNYNYQQLLQNKQYQRLIYLLYETRDIHQIFCCSCHIYRPGNAAHCRWCDCCYIGADHHCPWLGTCVAKNNYWTFLAFLVSLVALIVVMGLNILQFVSEQIGGVNGDSYSETIYVVLCFVIVGALVILLLGFFIFHLVLVCKGKTTRQYIKENKNKKTITQSSLTSKILEQHLSIDQPLVSQQTNFSQDLYSKKPIPNSSSTPTNSQPRFFDNYVINLYNLYQDQNIFYEELFQTRQALHFIDFKQKLSSEDSQFIQKGLAQLKQRKEKMIKEGQRYEYFKQVVVS